MIWDSLLDALLDSAKILPILYLAYLLVSYFSHNNNKKYHHFIMKTKKAGPFMGAVLGIVPQCGFSSFMADLFSKKSITIGTLVAVFLATSDEAIPILISQPTAYKWLALLIAIKFVAACVFGFLIDWLASLILRKKPVLAHAEALCDNPEHHHKQEDEHDSEHCCADNIFLDALKHTMVIIAFIFVATFLLNIVIESVGIERLSSALAIGTFWQPVIAGFIGLIPNCASSVLLVELFLEGAISFGACVAGLSVGSGVGLIVLFKQNRNWKQNLLVVALCLVIGIGIGMIVSIFC